MKSDPCLSPVGVFVASWIRLTPLDGFPTTCVIVDQSTPNAHRAVQRRCYEDGSIGAVVAAETGFHYVKMFIERPPLIRGGVVHQVTLEG